MLPFLLKSQSCFEDGLSLSNQIEAENFLLDNPNCSIIEGDLNVFFSSLENLDALQNIKEIKGNLIISESHNLSSLIGLKRLNAIGGSLIVSDNNSLHDLSGLDSLTSIDGSLIIENNQNLQSIKAIENLSNLKSTLKISGNSTLDSISMTSLTDTISSIDITSNSELHHIYIDGNLKSIEGSLRIDINPNLLTIEGFTKLEKINSNLTILNNSELKNVSGFDSLIRIGGGMSFNACDNIEEIPSFNNLVYSKSIQIALDRLKIIDGFYNLRDTIDDLIILRCDSLKSVNGFNKISHVKTRVLFGTTKDLISINGFDDLVSTRYLHLDYCPNLSTINAFESLEIIDSTFLIGGCNSLKNLDFVQSLKKVDEIIIRSATTSIITNGIDDIEGLSNIDVNYLTSLNISHCPNLSVCAYESICSYLEESNTNYFIENNDFGCNSREEILEACEMVSTDNIMNSHITINLYPNPATIVITIDCSEKIEKVEIHEINGQKVKELIIHSAQIDVSDLKNGLYLLTLSTNDGIYTKKVTITNNE